VGAQKARVEKGPQVGYEISTSCPASARAVALRDAHENGTKLHDGVKYHVRKAARARTTRRSGPSARQTASRLAAVRAYVERARDGSLSSAYRGIAWRACEMPSNQEPDHSPPATWTAASLARCSTGGSAACVLAATPAYPAAAASACCRQKSWPTPLSRRSSRTQRRFWTGRHRHHHEQGSSLHPVSSMVRTTR
jgi:hypothetical protein